MRPKSLLEFKEIVQAIFSNTLNDRDDRDDFADMSSSLKAYLVENNNPYLPNVPQFSEWMQLGELKPWFYAVMEEKPENFLIYDNSLGRVGVLYTMLKVRESTKIIEKWIFHTPNLDHCWLSKKQMMSFELSPFWEEKGIGLKYRNALGRHKQGDEASRISLKAWYGSGDNDEWKEDIKPIREKAALSSIRWKKIVDSETKMSIEWYNYGKVTVNYADDVDEVIQEISMMARRYHSALLDAEKMRNEKLCAFELLFAKDIDVGAFSECVAFGKSSLKLWMMETDESSRDFKRFRGVDLHTFDPIYMDVSQRYAYLTVPMGSCVNAAPRIAVIQSENTSGNTLIEFDGVEIFV